MNATWEEIVNRNPLVAFSWYLSGRVDCIRELGNEVLADLDGAISESGVDGSRFDDVVSNITPADVLAEHEDSYEDKA